MLLGFNYSESGQYQDGSGKSLWQVRQGMAAPYKLSGQKAKAFQKDDLWGKLQITPDLNQTILLEHTYGKATDIVTPRVAFDIEKDITQMSRASWEARNLGSWSNKLTLSFYRNDVEHDPVITGLFGTFEWTHSNSATDIDQYAGEQRIGAWDIFNLRLGYRFRFVTLNVGIDNLFDKKYASANSYEWYVVGGTGATPAIVNEPGRFVYGSLGFKW